MIVGRDRDGWWCAMAAGPSEALGSPEIVEVEPVWYLATGVGTVVVVAAVGGR
jgi:hypothetical protein